MWSPAASGKCSAEVVEVTGYSAALFGYRRCSNRM
jgi:hypothetical protein